MIKIDSCVDNGYDNLLISLCFFPDFEGFDVGPVFSPEAKNAKFLAFIVKIILPNESILSLFDDQLSTIFKLTKCLRTQNVNLRKTRNLLLPKLISGQIDVSDLDIGIGADAA